ncbi:tryptophan 7-halogenase [Sphingomonas aerolata]|uniref:tryptophan 7-halogenase n=1 Tax=Sphingomonas aerolata TaxID=185951 RepID=UPI002FDFC7C2
MPRRCPRRAPPPYTQIDAQDTGWTATWPLDGADVRLTCSMGGTGKPFRAARRVEAWRGNCVALGAAAGLLEPLHPIALTLLLRSLAQLIQLWPAGPEAPVEAAAFNRTAAGALQGARDFLIAHYAVAGRAGALWDDRRAASLPGPLAAKHALFAARGRLPMYDDEVFEEEDWAVMFDAMGLMPRRYDARADMVPLAAIERHLAEQRARVIAQVRALPLMRRRWPRCGRAHDDRRARPPHRHRRRRYGRLDGGGRACPAGPDRSKHHPDRIRRDRHRRRR